MSLSKREQVGEKEEERVRRGGRVNKREEYGGGF